MTSGDFTEIIFDKFSHHMRPSFLHSSNGYENELLLYVDLLHAFDDATRATTWY